MKLDIISLLVCYIRSSSPIVFFYSLSLYSWLKSDHHNVEVQVIALWCIFIIVHIHFPTLERILLTCYRRQQWCESQVLPGAPAPTTPPHTDQSNEGVRFTVMTFVSFSAGPEEEKKIGLLSRLDGFPPKSGLKISTSSPQCLFKLSIRSVTRLGMFVNRYCRTDTARRL